MKKIFSIALLIPIAVAAQSIDSSESQKTQTQGNPLADILGGFQKLLTTKSQEIEKLIELNELSAAVEKFLIYHSDLTTDSKAELKKKLKPFVDAETQDWSSKLEALHATSTNFNEVVTQFDSLDFANDTSVKKFYVFDIQKAQLDAALYDKKKRIFEVIVDSFLNSSGTEIKSSTAVFLRSDGHLLLSKCKLALAANSTKSLQIANLCKSYLPSVLASQLESSLAESKLSQLGTSNSAHQRIVEIDKVLRANGIAGSDYERSLLQFAPSLTPLDESNLKEWLREKKTSEVGVYLQSTDPSQTVSKSSRNSTFIAGYETIPNPQYLIAQRNYQAGVIDYQNCQANYRTQAVQNPYAVNLCGFVASNVNNAKSILDNTSPTVSREVLKHYSYEVNSIEVTKNGFVYVFAYSSDSKKFTFQKTPISKSKKFEIAVGLHPQDKNARSSWFQTENDIRKFVDEKLERPAKPEIYASLLKTTQQVDSPEKNLVQSSLNNVKNSPAEAKPTNIKSSNDLNDVLNNSIVVVKTRGGLGTGFYVKSKYVLTNRHVVEDQAMVEIEYKDGRKSNGVVIQSDAGLDLALIVVPAEGKPLSFLTKEAPIGAEAVALGHPKGLTFSVTKGIVSAVRDMPSSVGIPMSLRYVQTDVPINSGNSGGPLLVGDKVVGVNTFKRADSGVEGLGFALSSVKVIEWLNKSIPR